MIIHRPKEVEKIKEVSKWTMVYGRRKTGKTFLLKNFIDYNEYFFVKRDKGIISDEGEEMNYDTLIEILKRNLKNGNTIVVDEFHRLGDDFFDFLHSMKKRGKLILVSSTLFLSKKIFSEKSPLLGLFAEMPIKLIKLTDCLRVLKKLNINKKKLMELAIQIREPIAIDYINKKEQPEKMISKVINSSTQTIPALIGEIFVEEEKSISSIYEGILRAIAGGKVISGQISSYLYSNRLIKKDDPSLIQQHLKNLISYGIIKRIPMFNKNRFIYSHISPLARIYYYADEKYNISERRATQKEIERIVKELMPKIVEENIRETLARKNGLRETIIDTGDYELDGYLLKFKKPQIALEVKWKKITKKDIKRIKQKLQEVDAEKKVLFVPDKKEVPDSPSWLKVMDPSDLC